MRYFSTVEQEGDALHITVFERRPDGSASKVALLTSLSGASGKAAVHEISKLMTMGAFDQRDAGTLAQS